MTTEQLEATQTLLQHAQQHALEADERVQRARGEAERAEEERDLSVKREADTQRKLGAFVQMSQQAALLTLAPPSKGQDLAEQHHILQLNFRHLQARRPSTRSATNPPGSLLVPYNGPEPARARAHPNCPTSRVRCGAGHERSCRSASGQAKLHTTVTHSHARQAVLSGASLLW